MILLRIWWARLLGQNAIALLDWRGNIRYSRVARWRAADTDNCLWSWVYPTTHIGHICLLDDGTVVDPDGNSHYIKKWKYLDERLRVEQVLRGAEDFKI